uniref:U3-Liphistoxin-Lth1b_1 n=1 Tax=Liphistius thaleban TaxID=1905330 RepID=A0A4V2H8R3_9ARAC
MCKMSNQGFVCLLYVSVTIICIFCTTDGSTNITVDELRCHVSEAHGYLYSITDMVKKIQNRVPLDFNIVKECIAENRCNDSKGKCPERPIDCEEVFKQGYRVSGLYQIWPRSRILNGPIDVYCDMETDGGGWTVVQRRGDFDSPKDYFYQNWKTYKSGFGDLKKDFWIGNDNLFSLTNQRAYELRINLTDWEKNATFATYDAFWIDDEDHSYMLHVKGYRGTAGDSLLGHNGFKFTTKDKDNDTHDSNCAVMFKGAWWYTSCHASNLNGYYLRGKHESHADGVEWHAFRGHYYSLKDSIMMIRPAGLDRKLNIKETPE